MRKKHDGVMVGVIGAVLLGVLLLGHAPMARAADKLTLLQINILYAGNDTATIDEGKYQATIKAIKAAKADIIAVSEVRLDNPDEKNPGPTGPSIADRLAKSLGMGVFDQSRFYDQDNQRTKQHPAIWANAILSKYPIQKGTPLGLGASINVKGRSVYVFGLNLDYKPYPPYQLANIPYDNYPFIKTEAEAIKYANIAHKSAMDELTQEINQEAKAADLVVVMCDCNEPSWRDWNDDAVKAKLQPIKVAWPTSKRLEDMGFVDTYRAIYPDVTKNIGWTWTPTTEENDPKDHHDRIDFVFARAANLKVLSSKIIGEKPERADIVITPWVTDHRAVVSTISF